ncbi:MAG: MarR family transcriptional regulator [Pirellulales bacterium]
MLQYDFENSVGYWICLAQQSHQRALNDELAPHGITFRQAQVLGCLVLDSELTQSELANRLSIEPPTLVGILDRMERDGWIARHSCPDDRRKKLIRPTAAAEPVWAKIAACGLAVRAQATDGLSERQVTILKKLLAKVRKNLTTPAIVGSTHGG